MSSRGASKSQTCFTANNQLNCNTKLGDYLRSHHDKQIAISFAAPASPENYFHAICDYLIPYHHFSRKRGLLHTRTQVVICDTRPERFGLFKKIHAYLFPCHELNISDSPQPGTVELSRARDRFYYPRMLRRFSKHAVSNCDTAVPNGVLLVGRRASARPPSIADGRQHIRSVENFDHLADQLDSLCAQHSVEFKVIYNEDVAFEEQLRFYHKSKYVIGQHGAGLTNIIWMQRGTHCFEIQCSNRLPYFRQIAKAKRVNYHEVAPISFLPSMPTSEMLEHEKGRDETVKVAINDILNPLARLLVHK